MKKRIWEVANQLGMKSKKLLKIAQMQGMKVANVLNILEDDEIQKLIDYVSHTPVLKNGLPEENDNEVVGEEKLLDDGSLGENPATNLPQTEKQAKKEEQKNSGKHTFNESQQVVFPEVKDAKEKSAIHSIDEKPLLQEKNLEVRLNEEIKIVETALPQAKEEIKNTPVPDTKGASVISSDKVPVSQYAAGNIQDQKEKDRREQFKEDSDRIHTASYHASVQDRINIITQNRNPQSQNRNLQNQNRNLQNQNRNPQNQNRNPQNQNQNRNPQNQNQGQNRNPQNQNQGQNRNPQNQGQNRNPQNQGQNRNPQNQGQNRNPQNQGQNRNPQNQGQNRNPQNQGQNRNPQNQGQNRNLQIADYARNIQNTSKENQQDQNKKEGREQKNFQSKNNWVIRDNRLEKNLKDFAEETISVSKETKEIFPQKEVKDHKIPVSASSNKPRTIEITVPISLKDFSQLVGVRASVILQKLFDSNKNTPFHLNLNSILNESMVETLALELDKDVKIKKEENQEEMLLKELAKEDAPEDLISRAPVVTFMGHVDHGKTSLLDCIRKTNVAAGEAGGITQYIGASKIEYANQNIVFLDTPGHEAFTAMRARGANITDIVVLVVAGDDGVMPQTIEAINHAKAAEVPIIVAINKMDKPNARPDVVRQQLSKHGLICEQWHGDVICVEVSATTKKGINTLLDYILLVAEMQELKANPKRKASGTVLDARIVEGKGEVASLLIQNGTLRQGDTILCGKHYGRVREITMRDTNSSEYKKVKQAGPSMPVEICGLSGLPEAGDKFSVLDSLSVARNMAETRQKNIREQSLASTTRKFTLEEILKELQEGTSKELRIILKTDVQGSLEALSAKLQEIKHEEIKVKLLHAAVGGINERDIQLADASRALILGFNVSANKAARDMADEKKIEIRKYNVIYHVLEDIKKIMSGMLAPKISEEVTGHITVRKIIHISKVGNVAGCYVTDGIIERNSKIRLYRNGIMLNKEKPLELLSLKHFKEDVGKVKAGFECGVKLDGFDDIKEGDELEAFKLIKSERYLE